MADLEEDASNHDVPDEDLIRLARSLSSLLFSVHALAQQEMKGGFTDRIALHLEVDPRGLPVVSQQLPPYQLVDLNVALEEWAEGGTEAREMEVLGVSGDQRRFQPLSELLGGPLLHGVDIGPVEYVDLADSADSTRSCVRLGLYLLADGSRRAALLLRGPDPHGPIQQAIVEVLAEDRAFAHDILEELKVLAIEHSVLRGQVLGFGSGEGNHYGALRFVKRPDLARSELVLPEATFAQIERHVIGIAAHGQQLRAGGQHLKRGVLLYGPPGTGKTHTVRYLLSQLRETTAFVLSGQALSMIGQACALARVLQPSLVVLEDVDLIAPDRSFGPVGAHPVLYEVLNQIDGLGDDVDVTFLLTTNRVDILERALTERPGRVDAAVEIAVPDEDGRRRLFRLYGSGVGLADLGEADLAPAVAATEGRTATYIREVVRRGALRAADGASDSPIRVDGETLAAAANELLEDRATLTRAVLGEPQEPDAEPPVGRPPQMMSSGVMMRTMGRMIGHPGASGDPPPFAPDKVV